MYGSTKAPCFRANFNGDMNYRMENGIWTIVPSPSALGRLWCSVCLRMADLEKLEDLINQDGRPDDGFEKADHTFLKFPGLADILDQGADEAQTIDTIRSASMDDHIRLLNCAFF